MPLKSYKPTSPGQRDLVLVDKSDLFKGKPIKKLTVGLKKSGGRTSVPQIFFKDRHIGGCDDLFKLEEDNGLENFVK